MTMPLHYVYLYRDERGKVRYVGYGEQVARATAHQIASHNPALTDFLSKGKYTVEVAGPFGTEDIGRAVETAIISALKPDLNVNKGASKHRFRPLGVPEQFAERITQPALQKNEFLTLQGKNPMPVLFVRITSQDFGDGRVGYDLAHPPSDAQVEERVHKWWQLNKFLQEWEAEPTKSPGLLVGIHGSPGSQLIVAAILIDRSSWRPAEHYERDKSKIRVPTLTTPNLDAFNLRGRRINQEAGLAFNSFSAEAYILLNQDGQLTGGRRRRRQ